MIRYSVHPHAVKRAKERLELKGTVDNTLVQYMVKAVRGAKTPQGGVIYDNYAKNARLIVDEAAHEIKTVYRLDTIKVEGNEMIVRVMDGMNITVDRIATAIKRELSRMTTQINREVRKLTEQAATIQVEIAQLHVNKIRCKHPKTQSLIQTRIDELSAKVDDLAKVIDGKLTQMQTAKVEVEAVVGE